MLSEVYSEENAFILKKVDEVEKQEIKFIQSFIPILDKFSKAIILNRQKYFQEKCLSIITDLLEQLIFFVLDIESKADHEAMDIDVKPNPRKQRLIKDMKVIEILTDILYYPFKNKMFALCPTDGVRQISSSP